MKNIKLNTIVTCLDSASSKLLNCKSVWDLFNDWKNLLNYFKEIKFRNSCFVAIQLERKIDRCCNRVPPNGEYLGYVPC